LVVVQVGGDRLKDHIYTDFQSDSIRSCFRRLNGTQVTAPQLSHQNQMPGLRMKRNPQIIVDENTFILDFFILILKTWPAMQ
jgi:hypothetical protein